MTMFPSVFVFAVLTLELINSENVTDFKVNFDPSGDLQVIMEEVITVDGSLELDDPMSNDQIHRDTESRDFIHLDIPNSTVARIIDNSTFARQHRWCSNSTPARICFNVTSQVQGVFLGRTNVIFYRGKRTDDRDVLPVHYPVRVVRPSNPLSNIFLYSIAVVIAINNIGFGCTLDLQEMRRLLKRPIPPLIGLCCQFVINPLIAYGSGKLFGLSPPLAFGLFAFGCSPGGGNSNLWSLVLDGDVDLSILMTFSSIFAAFGMVPLWMYALGRSIVPDDVQIPYANMFIALALVLLPCLIGLAIKRFLPKFATIIRRILKPVSIVVVILIIPLVIYTNLHVFSIMRDWRVICSCILLPFSAFVLSAAISWMCRQSRARILTISIETAIQNIGTATVMLLSSLPSPEGDLAIAMPIIAAIFTPIPLFFILFVKFWRQRCWSSGAIIEDKYIENVIDDMPARCTIDNTMESYTKHTTKNCTIDSPKSSDHSS